MRDEVDVKLRCLIVRSSGRIKAVGSGYPKHW